VLADFVDLQISNSKITAICENFTGSAFAIGTRGGDIIEFTNEKPR
jgi:hypothetical protein